MEVKLSTAEDVCERIKPMSISGKEKPKVTFKILYQKSLSRFYRGLVLNINF